MNVMSFNTLIWTILNQLTTIQAHNISNNLIHKANIIYAAKTSFFAKYPFRLFTRLLYSSRNTFQSFCEQENQDLT